MILSQLNNDKLSSQPCETAPLYQRGCFYGGETAPLDPILKLFCVSRLMWKILEFSCGNVLFRPEIGATGLLKSDSV